MNTEAKILIVDDDPSFLETYREILGEEGYLIATASDRASALARLESDRISAVLLDQKLQGVTGPDSGLDLLAEIQRLRPETKIIVVTAYPSPASVERAFTAGGHDFLEKTEVLPALLRAKLRNLLELYRAEQQANLSRHELRQLLASARTEKDRQRKGKLFEDFVVGLFRAMPEFCAIADVNLDNGVEEIDVILVNRATEAPWRDEGAYFLVECKNWSSRVDRREYDVLLGKMRRRRTCKVGLLLAPGGFTAAFREALKIDAQNHPYIIPLDLAAIERLVDAPDRLAELNRLHLASTFDPGAK